MKNQVLIALLLVVFLLVSGCQQSPVPTLPASPEAEPIDTNSGLSGEQETALELISPTTSKLLTMVEVQQLPAVEGQAGFKSSTGAITPPVIHKGVRLLDLLELVGGFDETMSVSVVAKDGYAITYSYNQIVNGDFIAYDPATGDEREMEEHLEAIIAYERDGQAIDANSEGPLRMVIISPKNNQVTDGHWAVKWVAKIEVKPVQMEWVLDLQGAVSEIMDKGTFESGAAPGCHQEEWKDDQAQSWIGIPLYLLVGRIDDEIKHDGPAYNRTLAEGGYTIEVVAADGYSVTLDSKRVYYNRDIMVTYLMNGSPLPEKHFPLMLVGSDLQKNEMVGAISKIIVHLGEASSTTPVETEAAETSKTEPETAAKPVEGAALTIHGAVNQPLSFSLEALQAMDVVTINAMHPKKETEESYEGVRLNALLLLAGLKPDASQVVITAADGFSATVDLSAIQGCFDCLVGFNNQAGLKMVMPGLDSNTWVKDVVLIEIK